MPHKTSHRFGNKVEEWRWNENDPNQKENALAVVDIRKAKPRKEFDSIAFKRYRYHLARYLWQREQHEHGANERKHF